MLSTFLNPTVKPTINKIRARFYKKVTLVILDHNSRVLKAKTKKLF